jgi:hypothetical protein
MSGGAEQTEVHSSYNEFTAARLQDLGGDLAKYNGRLVSFAAIGLYLALASHLLPCFLIHYVYIIAGLDKHIYISRTDSGAKRLG